MDIVVTASPNPQTLPACGAAQAFTATLQSPGGYPPPRTGIVNFSIVHAGQGMQPHSGAKTAPLGAAPINFNGYYSTAQLELPGFKAPAGTYLILASFAGQEYAYLAAQGQGLFMIHEFCSADFWPLNEILHP